METLGRGMRAIYDGCHASAEALAGCQGDALVFKIILGVFAAVVVVGGVCACIQIARQT